MGTPNVGLAMSERSYKLTLDLQYDLSIYSIFALFTSSKLLNYLYKKISIFTVYPRV